MTPATLTRDEALKRLAGCRAAQPGIAQLIVASEIVDALLRPDCPVCHGDGEVMTNPGYPDPQEAVPERCPECGGAG